MASPPRRRLQGVQAPVHVLDTLESIQRVENEINAQMGAESKVSLSDLVSDALADFVRAWIRVNGPMPTDKAARAKWVGEIAEARVAKLHAQLADEAKRG